MVESRERFTANNADIGEMCARIERFLAREGLAEREGTRLRLTMERLLRRIAERRGWGTRCELTLGRRWGRAFIRLSYLGEAFDPTLVGRESESEAWSARLLTGLGLVPEWSWRRGVNHLLLRVHARERGTLAAPLLATALGVALCFALGAMGEDWLAAARRDVFAPLTGAFLGAASLLAALKIFFAAVCAVSGAAETASGRVGRLAVARFVGFDALAALAGAAALAALYRVDFTGARDLSLLWRLAPADPVSPLRNADATQLALLGAAFGASLHVLGARGARLREWAEACDAALAALWETLCRLSPAAILAAVCCAPPASLLRVWRPLAAFALCALGAALCLLLAASARLHVRPDRMLARVCASGALTPRPFDAALGALMDRCENELGVAHPVVLTGLSVGSVLWKPFAVLSFCAAALCFTAARGAAGVGALTLTALGALALCVALPAHTGTLLLALPLLAPGLGAEELALAAALDAPLWAAAAALGGLALQWELLLEAKRLELLNEKLWK